MIPVGKVEITVCVIATVTVEVDGAWVIVVVGVKVTIWTRSEVTIQALAVVGRDLTESVHE